MSKRLTIKDIARELNVHHSTVSRALRNDPRVNEKTRDLVLAYAREHQFQINLNAVKLRGSRNNAIALIVPNINHTFFADIVSHLTDLAYASGYVISVFQTNESHQLEREIINTIVQHNFAGVIVSIAKDTHSSDHFAILRKFGIPLVFFDRVCPGVECPQVVVDNFDITAQATQYLLDRNFRKIVHITGSQHINVFSERQKGYLSVIREHKIGYEMPVVVDEDFTIGVGQSLFARLWSSDEKPDAIISSSLYMTLGIMLEARKLGIKIPDDLAIITFGNILTSEILEPQITYIDQPEEEIAQCALQLLEQMMNNEISPNEQIRKVIKAKLILRNSC